jgi:hypothetical protein
MNIALINGSPKVKESASAIILKDLGSLLDDQELQSVEIHKSSITEEQVALILDCDALVFAFPLYVDGVPSHLLSVLESIEKSAHNIPSRGKKRMVYTMVNCGFYESKQNNIAIEIMQHFAKHAGFVFGQGIGFGAGGMIASLSNVPLGHGPKRNYGTALVELADHIKKGQSGDTLYPKMNFPRFLYQQAAQLSMKKTAKQNGCKRRDLDKRL